MYKLFRNGFAQQSHRIVLHSQDIVTRTRVIFLAVEISRRVFVRPNRVISGVRCQSLCMPRNTSRQFIKEEDKVGCWVVCLCAGLKGLRTNKQANKTLHGISVGKLIHAHSMLYRTYCTGTVHSVQMLCVAKPSLNS